MELCPPLPKLPGLSAIQDHLPGDPEPGHLQDDGSLAAVRHQKVVGSVTFFSLSSVTRGSRSRPTGGAPQSATPLSTEPGDHLPLPLIGPVPRPPGHTP
jgi:hypothetical protein